MTVSDLDDGTLLRERPDAGRDDPVAAVTVARRSIVRQRIPWLAAASAVAALGLAWYSDAVPDLRYWPGRGLVTRLDLAGAGLLTVLAVAGVLIGWVREKLTAGGPRLLAAVAILAVWEALTAKSGTLPLPWFPPPASVVTVFVDDHDTLLRSTLYSLRLLLFGSLIGAVAGFVTGVAIAWWKTVGYWVHPVLKLIGPVPATAWLPIVFVVFPTSFSASTFLVALSAWFPVTVLTWSGVASVNSGYFDVARTLGAGQWFLIRKVAVPAALPHVFVGLFMGLGSTFVTLIVAEMLGVKAGLGWYIQWAIGWAAYNKMYAALAVMAVLFSGLLSIVFAVRDHFLGWQKGLLRW
jgi:NitT/TauT family transport system permease protein